MNIAIPYIKMAGTNLLKRLSGSLPSYSPFNISLSESRLRALEALLSAAGIENWRLNESSADLANLTSREGIGKGQLFFGSDSKPSSFPVSTGDRQSIAELGDVCAVQSALYVDYTQQESVRNIFIVLYCVVAALSLTGNLMVIWTVWKKKHMRTVTDYYILNLAVSDFLIALFVVPLKLLEYTAPCSWQVFSNDALCSALSFVLPVFVFASVFTLVAISLER